MDTSLRVLGRNEVEWNRIFNDQINQIYIRWRGNINIQYSLWKLTQAGDYHAYPNPDVFDPNLRFIEKQLSETREARTKLRDLKARILSVYNTFIDTMDELREGLTMDELREELGAENLLVPQYEIRLNKYLRRIYEFENILDAAEHELEFFEEGAIHLNSNGEVDWPSDIL